MSYTVKEGELLCNIETRKEFINILPCKRLKIWTDIRIIVCKFLTQIEYWDGGL